MKIKSQQYWAIIITLLFHTVLFWLLFFAEVYKSEKEMTYEIALEPESLQELEEEKQAEIERKANEQLQEILSNRAAKRMVRNEETQEMQFTEETKQLQEEFEQRQMQSKTLQKTQKTPQITFSEKEEKGESNAQAEASAPAQTVFYIGKSRVEYFLAERYRIKLPIPVYKCEGAGTVEVAITVNRQGMVVAAQVMKERSHSASECMQEAALNAALTSVFSERPEALVAQQGRIVYQFAAQ